MRVAVILLSMVLFTFIAAPVYKPLPKPLPRSLPETTAPVTPGQTTTEKKDGFESAPKELQVIEVKDPEKELPVQIRNITATISNTSEDTFTSVVVTCSFSDATGTSPTVSSKQAVLPSLGPKEQKSVSFSWNTAIDFAGFARFTGYDPAGAKRYDTPINIGSAKIEIISASRIVKQEPTKKQDKKSEPAKAETTKKEETKSSQTEKNK